MVVYTNIFIFVEQEFISSNQILQEFHVLNLQDFCPVFLEFLFLLVTLVM